VEGVKTPVRRGMRVLTPFTSARLRKRRYTTSTDMTVPGCSTRRVPLLDRRMLKKPLAGMGYGSQRPLR
jgi:hypothetical protein